MYVVSVRHVFLAAYTPAVHVLWLAPAGRTRGDPVLRSRTVGSEYTSVQNMRRNGLAELVFPASAGMCRSCVASVVKSVLFQDSNAPPAVMSGCLKPGKRFVWLAIPISYDSGSYSLPLGLTAVSHVPVLLTSRRS